MFNNSCLTCDAVVEFAKRYVWALFDQVLKINPVFLFLQQDRAPPHGTEKNLQYLASKYPYIISRRPNHSINKDFGSTTFKVSRAIFLHQFKPHWVYVAYKMTALERFLFADKNVDYSKTTRRIFIL